jgi:hypothetical protein
LIIRWPEKSPSPALIIPGGFTAKRKMGNTIEITVDSLKVELKIYGNQHKKSILFSFTDLVLQPPVLILIRQYWTSLGFISLP